MFKHILVPVDGSKTSMLAVSKAAGLAKTFGSAVTAVYVIDPYPFTGVGADFAYGQAQYISAATAEANGIHSQLASNRPETSWPWPLPFPTVGWEPGWVAPATCVPHSHSECTCPACRALPQAMPRSITCTLCHCLATRYLPYASNLPWHSSSSALLDRRYRL